MISCREHQSPKRKKELTRGYLPFEPDLSSQNRGFLDFEIITEINFGIKKKQKDEGKEELIKVPLPQRAL